jgi:hypothetical protein
VIIQFFEGNIHDASGKLVVKDVISDTLGLSFFEKENFVVCSARNQGVEICVKICHDSPEGSVCIHKEAVSARSSCS